MELYAEQLQRSVEEPGAFDAFYRALAPPLLRSLTRRTLDAETALDLTAETMAHAFLGRDRFSGTTDAEARAWLYAIADHKLASFLRRRRVETKALERLGLERPRVEDEAEVLEIERDALGELQRQIALGLTRLSEEQREAIELRIVQQRSYAEISTALAISEPAARARLSRAIQRLRQVLEQMPTTEVS